MVIQPFKGEQLQQSVACSFTHSLIRSFDDRRLLCSVTPKPPASFEESTLKKLEAAVEAVYNVRGVESSQEELYRVRLALLAACLTVVLVSRSRGACSRWRACASTRRRRSCTRACTRSAAPTSPTPSAGSSVRPRPDFFVLPACFPAQRLALAPRPSSFGRAGQSSGEPLVFLQQMEAKWRDHCDQARPSAQLCLLFPVHLPIPFPFPLPSAATLSLSSSERSPCLVPCACAQMLTIRGIFLYLDRTWVIQNQNPKTQIRSLWDMGLLLFCEAFRAQGQGEAERRTVAGLLMLVENERRGYATLACVVVVPHVLVVRALALGLARAQ